MASFQKIVLIIAVVILIISLAIIAYALRYKKTGSWPPVVGECPDYWVDRDASGNGGKCINIQDLGTCKAKTGDPHLVMDFNNQLFKGPNGMCAKYKWAQKCNVSWDGITYGRLNNPCDPSGNSTTGTCSS